MKKNLIFTLMFVIALLGYNNKNYAQNNCVLQVDNNNNTVIQNSSSSQAYFIIYNSPGQKIAVINPGTALSLGSALPTISSNKQSLTYPSTVSILNQLPCAPYNAADATLTALYVADAVTKTKYNVSPAFSPDITTYSITIPKSTGYFNLVAQPTQAVTIQIFGSINNGTYSYFGVPIVPISSNLPLPSLSFLENGTTSGTVNVKLASPDKSTTSIYTINYTVQ